MMTPLFDRIPGAERDGFRRLTPIEDEDNIYKVEFADDPSQYGTPVNRVLFAERLAAMGTTVGTPTALGLEQEGFSLFDGALVRIQPHVDVDSSATLSVENIPAKKILYPSNRPVGIGLMRGSWTDLIYSQPLDAWIIQDSLGVVVAEKNGNTFIGLGSGNVNNTGSVNTLAGYNSGALITTGHSNVITGAYAGYNNSTGYHNAFYGYQAGYQNTTGYFNTFIGGMAGYDNTTGYSNVFTGTSAGIHNTSGASNASIGSYSGRRNTTGSYNVYIGSESGAYHETGAFTIFEGHNAGSILSDGVTPQKHSIRSIFIGNEIRGYSLDNQINQIVIGNTAIGEGSNTIRLGNTSITKFSCQVGLSTPSDRRIKEDIEPANLDLCVDAVKNLPVNRYKYKDFTGVHLDKHVTGFLADDVEHVFPKAVQKANQYYPVLDESGNPVYETVIDKVPDGVDDDGNEIFREEPREVQKMFLLEDVKDITMTEAVPTLWGAMQKLIERVEELEAAF